MHADQIAIDVATARALIQSQFPDLCAETVEPVQGSGTENAIFRVGASACARFPLRPSQPGPCLAAIGAQASAMSAFADRSPVPAPRPLGIGRPGDRYPLPWMLVSWVPGDVVTPAAMEASEPFAHDLARLVIALRNSSTGGRRFGGQGRGGSLTDHDAWVSECIARSATDVDPRRVEALWHALRAMPACGPDVMSHRDLIPFNLLVHAGRLAGVLDTGQFGPADPALDLVVAWHTLDRPRRAAFRARLGSGDTEWRRGAAWALQQALGLVWYYRESVPAMSQLGLSTVGRLLSDPDLPR